MVNRAQASGRQYDFEVKELAPQSSVRMLTDTPAHLDSQTDITFRLWNVLVWHYSEARESAHRCSTVFNFGLSALYKGYIHVDSLIAPLIPVGQLQLVMVKRSTG
jgi:hypothetical protein